MTTPAPELYDGKRDIAVEDNYRRIHRSEPGRGVLCDQIRTDVSRNPRGWTYDLTAIDCPDCRRLA